MRIELIPEAGKFYKTNLHCHTNISDGRDTPEQVKECYKKAGYSAVCFTDHEVLLDQSALCDPDFIALHGYEVCIKQDITKHTAQFLKVYHFNLLAKDQKNLKMPRFFKENPSCPGNARKWMDECAQYEETIPTTVYDIDWINDYLKAVKEAGFLITYNHPMWSLQNYSDYIGLEHLHAVELINGGCVALNDNTSLHYEAMLRAGKNLVPVGGDDNHSDFEKFKGWTMIKAPELSYAALMEAYEKGHCYASEGPEILSLVLENNKLRIKTSPAAGIHLLTEGRYIDDRFSRTETYTEAEFDYVPEMFGRYFRFEVRDKEGYKAFSNAYYIEDLK